MMGSPHEEVSGRMPGVRGYFRRTEYNAVHKRLNRTTERG